MGNRISISFKNKDRESVVLFSHWYGLSMLADVKSYLVKLDSEVKKGNCYPLGRREPATVILDFIIRLLGKETHSISNFSLGKSRNDGDNSDNGHFTFDLGKRKIIHYRYSWKECKITKGRKYDSF